jgi:hypothetical protein
LDFAPQRQASLDKGFEDNPLLPLLHFATRYSHLDASQQPQSLHLVSVELALVLEFPLQAAGLSVPALLGQVLVLVAIALVAVLVAVAAELVAVDGTLQIFHWQLSSF